MERNLFEHRIERFGRDRPPHVGEHDPRRDGVDGDRALRQFTADDLREPDDTGLRGGVVGLPEESDRRADRGDVDDPSAVADPITGGPAAVEDAGEIRVDHRLPVVSGHLPQRLVAKNAGVVDEDVEATEAIDGPIDHPFDGGQVADVSGDRRRPVAEAGNGPLGSGRVLPGFIGEKPDGDIRPGLMERLGGDEAEPLAAAGDKRRLSTEIDREHSNASVSRGWPGNAVDGCGHRP